MEEKGIVHPELSCRIAAELPPPDCPRSFGSSSAPGIHRRSCRTAARRLRRQQSKLRRQSGNSGAGSSAAVRQHSSRSTIPFSSMSRLMDFRDECKLQPVGHGQDAQVPAAALPPAACSSLPTPSPQPVHQLPPDPFPQPVPHACRGPAALSQALVLSPSTSSLLTPSPQPILQLPPDPFSSPRPPAPSRPLLLSPSPRLTAGLLAWVEEGNRADSLPWKLQGRVL
ncbi:unnamed protein product [Boreogadus saida]